MSFGLQSEPYVLKIGPYWLKTDWILIPILQSLKSILNTSTYFVLVNALKNMYSVCCVSVCSISEVMLPRMLHSTKRNPPTKISFFSKSYYTNHIIIFSVHIFQKVNRISLSTLQCHYFRSIYNYNIVMNCHHCMANSRKRQFRSF